MIVPSAAQRGRHRRLSKTGRPDFVVIGAQKSASTFVQSCLNDHPDIFLPHPETPIFESPDYEEAPADFWRILFDGRTERLKGIKRPNYIGKTEVPSRLATELPEANLIAVLRNPVDRAVAAYFHQMKYGTIPICPLEVGLPAILDGGSILDTHPRSREILEFGLYFRHLKNYEHFSERGQLLCLLHDDIAADPVTEIQRCYDFLGVDASYVPSNLAGRPQKVVYSIPRLHFLNLSNEFQYLYNEDRTRLDKRALDPARWLCVAAVHGIDRFILSRFLPASKPTVSAELRQRLLDFYATDITALEDFLGRDLSGWRKGGVA